MTRFARARGSKSSNERLPEEATSWQVMKKQLQDAQLQQDTQKNIQNYRDILKNESEDDGNRQWAEFETKPMKNKKKRKKMETSIGEEKDSHSSVKVNMKESDDFEGRKSTEEKAGKIEKGKKRKLVTTEINEVDISSQDKPKKRRKKSKQNKQEAVEEAPNNSEPANNKKRKGSFKDDNPNASFENRHQKSGKEYKRRKPDLNNETMFINGQQVAIVKFDGFPIKKEDADRLKELRQKLIAKGIPRDEMKRVMKLERRKAEKALARDRKKVCFHCRKPGHVLSECPELGDGKNENAQATGICFKCGSTEHTHFECRVNRSEGFQFAKCFICKEQGHIARQCPDNPRGLYPKGGGCRVCGDVTHLKKDCPDLLQEKKEQTVTVETMKSGALEGLDEDLKEKKKLPPSKKQKHIKF